MQLTDEGDKPIVVNADKVCFFRCCAPDGVEIHFVGETSTRETLIKSSLSTASTDKVVPA
jgi:hypothetical protein